MKAIKYKITIAAILFGSSLFSCTDMSETVYSQLPADQFFKSQKDVIEAMGPIYSGFRPMLAWQQWWDLDDASDAQVTPTRAGGWYDGGIYIRLSRHTWDAYDPHFESLWNLLFSDINNCNRVLYQIKNANFDIEGKAAFVAEIRTARAYCYYILCDEFGNVPIVDRFDIPADSLPSTSSQHAVFDFIVSELNQSIPDLSEEAKGAMYGRFNKWAGYTLLARMYLNAEVWKGEAMWTKCIEATSQVINAKKYVLEPDLKANFTLNNDQSDEIIFSYPFDETNTPNETIYMAYQKSLHPENLAKTYLALCGSYNGVQAVPAFVNTFDTTDKRYKETFVRGQQYGSNGDSLFCIGWVPNDIGKPLKYTNTLSSLTNAHEYEGYRYGRFEIKMGTQVACDNDWPVMRYAEVLMMKAEALLRLGRADEAAVLVNQVRARDFSEPKPVTGAELEATIKVDHVPVKYGRMLEELGWEFASEGRRRDQQIRFGNFLKGTWEGHEQPDDADFRKLFPIPANIIASNPNLKQNPGYK